MMEVLVIMMKNRHKNRGKAQYAKIVALGGHQMSKTGYKATSLEDIARAVGIHKSTFFHYFKSKEELLAEIVKPGIEEVQKNLIEILNNNELFPRQKLRNAILNHLYMLMKYKDNVTVYRDEAGFLPPVEREKNLKVRKDYIHLFQKIITEVVDSDPKRFKGIDVKILNYGVLGMCNFFLRWYRKSGRYSSDCVAEMFCRIILPED